MGLNFRKRIKICKGVNLNLSKSGLGLSVGTKGCRYSINTSGRKTATVGIPGTGIYYSKSFGGKKKKNYSSSAYKKKQQIEQDKNAAKQDELEQNRLLVQEFENYIEIMKGVHKECEETIDWEEILTRPAPFEYGLKGEKQVEAEAKYNNFKPSFFDNLLGNGGEKKKQQLLEAIDAAKKEDEEAYENWQAMHDFAENIINGDIDSYLVAIDEVNPFEDLVEYGSDFEVGTDSKDSMTVEFNVKSDIVVPTISMSLTSTGKVSKKNLTKTQHYDYMQDYVCSCVIRLARELFAILPVNIVIVHAVDGVLDTTTGNEEEITILSVKFERDRFDGINFDFIDPSDFVGTFENNMEFVKTAGFKPVYRIDE